MCRGLRHGLVPLRRVQRASIISIELPWTCMPLTATRYQISPPTVLWGNFFCSSSKRAIASSPVGAWYMAIVRFKEVNLKFWVGRWYMPWSGENRILDRLSEESLRRQKDVVMIFAAWILAEEHFYVRLFDTDSPLKQHSSTGCLDSLTPLAIRPAHFLIPVCTLQIQLTVCSLCTYHKRLLSCGSQRPDNRNLWPSLSQEEHTVSRICIWK